MRRKGADRNIPATAAACSETNGAKRAWRVLIRATMKRRCEGAHPRPSRQCQDQGHLSQRHPDSDGMKPQTHAGAINSRGGASELLIRGMEPSLWGLHMGCWANHDRDSIPQWMGALRGAQTLSFISWLCTAQALEKC